MKRQNEDLGELAPRNEHQAVVTQSQVAVPTHQMQMADAQLAGGHRQKLDNYAAVPVLLEMLVAADEMCRLTAIQVVHQLARQPANRHRIVASGGAAVLVGVCLKEKGVRGEDAAPLSCYYARSCSRCSR